MFRDVLPDQTPAYRLLERLVSGGVDYLDAAGRQTGLEFLPVESVELHSGQLAELDLTERRRDVQPRGFLAALVGPQAHRVARGLQPAPQVPLHGKAL